MFRGRYVQYLSSESDSSADYGYTRRDDDPGTVGGGTPWEPPVPANELKETTPTVIVWNERDDERLTGAEDWSGPANPDDVAWKGVPICLYQRRDTTTNAEKVVTGYRWFNYSEGEEYTVTKWAYDAFGAQGALLRMPYYWDGVSAHVVPEVQIEVPYKIGATTVGTGLYIRVKAAGGTDHDINLSHAANTTGLVAATWIAIDSTQQSTFVRGWNSFEFRMGFRNTAGNQGFWMPGGQFAGTDRGYCPMIISCKTSVPVGFEFEFKVQQNWKTYFDVDVLINGTLTPGDDNGNDASRSWLGPGGHRDSSNVGVSYDTTMVWDVWSVWPEDYDEFWWLFPIKQTMRYNFESGMRPIVCGERDVGSSDLELYPVQEDVNYFKCEDTLVNTAPTGGNRQWRMKSSPRGVMSWVPATHVPLPKSTGDSNELYWFVPYNAKALTYLKNVSTGAVSNDTWP